MTERKRELYSKGASGEQSNFPKLIRPRCRLTHGLFFDPRNFYIDGRTRLSKTLKSITQALLERFPSPAPAGAQLIAQRAAFKAIRLAAFEHFILLGDGEPPPSTDQTYLTIASALRADIEALHRMSRDYAKESEIIPSLQDYLSEVKKAAAVTVECKPLDVAPSGESEAEEPE